jgi:citrate lyase subunit beta/citryl-CoA lyase|tara:strand:- start:2704 stop:3579 length:876 start_codon:yes stop_codon:yes gene_type:complete
MRSKLFVPGARPDLFSKALAGPADAISIDMEDSIVDKQKSFARENVKHFLSSSEASKSLKYIIVRCNGIDTPHFKHDIKSLVRPNLSMINLPKIECRDDVLYAVSHIEESEKENGITNPIPLLINIETPKGLRNAAEISVSHKRIIGLQLGLNDLFNLSGIDRYDFASVHNVMLLVSLAASEARIKVYDGAYPDIDNIQGLEDEAKMARRMGFSGKSCVHPSQVEPVNQLFIPELEEIALAERILSKAKKTESTGVGVFTVDGLMIDAPAIEKAKSLLSEYEHTRKSNKDT